MKIYNLLQLNPSKYVILDGDFKRLNKTGAEPVRAADKTRVIMSLGQTILFIKKNKGIYNSYIKFHIPQLKQVLKEHDILKQIANESTTG